VISDAATAKQVSELMLDISARLDQSVLAVQGAGSAEELAVYRRAVGGVMGEILLEILNPLYARHPQLKPKGLI
jgi:hypothetical protein